MSAHPPVPQRVVATLDSYESAMIAMATGKLSITDSDVIRTRLLAAIADAIEQARPHDAELVSRQWHNERVIEATLDMAERMAKLAANAADMERCLQAEIGRADEYRAERDAQMNMVADLSESLTIANETVAMLDSRVTRLATALAASETRVIELQRTLARSVPHPPPATILPDPMFTKVTR